jgi:hypothetical protein
VSPILLRCHDRCTGASLAKTAAPDNHGTFQPCAGMSVASVSFTQAGSS